MGEGKGRGLCPRLVDYFCIVGSHKPPHRPQTTQPPEMLARYPSTDHRDFILPRDMVYFCQPDGCTFTSPKRPQARETQSFVFTLTDKDSGITRFGVCLNFYRGVERRGSPRAASKRESWTRGTDRSTDSAFSSDYRSHSTLGPSDSDREREESAKHRHQTDQHLHLHDPLSSNAPWDAGYASRDAVPHFRKSRDVVDVLAAPDSDGENMADTRQRRRRDSGRKTNSRTQSLTSICLVSSHPFFSSFRSCLGSLKTLVDACSGPSTRRKDRSGKQSSDCVWRVLTGAGSESVSSFLLHDIREIETWILRLLSAPIPVANRTRLELEIIDRRYGPLLIFALPDPTRFGLCDFPLHLPLELLGVDTTLQVLTLVMLESKVVMESRDLNSLSLSVIALTHLMYPLQYMFPMIPILPTSMPGAEQLLLAPTPYIIGLPSSFLPSKTNFTVPDDVWRVDLDSGRIHPPPRHSLEEVPPLPEPEGRTLKSHLRQALASLSIQPISNLDLMHPDKVAAILRNSRELEENTGVCGFNPFIYGNDVDSVDIATRVAMVRFFNSANVLANFTEHTRTLRLYPRPVVAFQTNSLIRSRPKSSTFLSRLSTTQAVEFYAEWALMPSNLAFQRIHTGLLDPIVIGDKFKWYAHNLEPVSFIVWDNLSSLNQALKSIKELDTPATDESGSDSEGGSSTSSFSSSSDQGHHNPINLNQPLNEPACADQHDSHLSYNGSSLSQPSYSSDYSQPYGSDHGYTNQSVINKPVDAGPTRFQNHKPASAPEIMLGDGSHPSSSNPIVSGRPAPLGNNDVGAQFQTKPWAQPHFNQKGNPSFLYDSSKQVNELNSSNLQTQNRANLLHDPKRTAKLNDPSRSYHLQDPNRSNHLHESKRTNNQLQEPIRSNHFKDQNRTNQYNDHNRSSLLQEPNRSPRSDHSEATWTSSKPYSSQSVLPSARRCGYIGVDQDKIYNPPQTIQVPDSEPAYCLPVSSEDSPSEGESLSSLNQDHSKNPPQSNPSVEEGLTSESENSSATCKTVRHNSTKNLCPSGSELSLVGTDAETPKGPPSAINKLAANFAVKFPRSRFSESSSSSGSRKVSDSRQSSTEDVAQELFANIEQFTKQAKKAAESLETAGKSAVSASKSKAIAKGYVKKDTIEDLDDVRKNVVDDIKTAIEKKNDILKALGDSGEKSGGGSRSDDPPGPGEPPAPVREYSSKYCNDREYCGKYSNDRESNSKYSNETYTDYSRQVSSTSTRLSSEDAVFEEDDPPPFLANIGTDISGLASQTSDFIGGLFVVDASAPVGAVGGKLEDGQGPGSCCSEIHDVGPKGPDVDLGSRRHPEPQGPEGTDHGPYSVSTDSPAKYEYYYEGRGSMSMPGSAAGSPTGTPRPAQPRPIRHNQGPFPRGRRGLVERSSLIRHPSSRSMEAVRMNQTLEQKNAITAENHAFVKDVIDQVLSGDGVGWLKLNRLRKLMEDENYRNMILAKINRTMDRRIGPDDHLDDVCLKRSVYKGMLKIILAVIHGLDGSVGNQGIGGIASAFQLLEIAHTHYWSKDISENIEHGLLPSSGGVSRAMSLTSSPIGGSRENINKLKVPNSPFHTDCDEFIRDESGESRKSSNSNHSEHQESTGDLLKELIQQKKHLLLGRLASVDSETESECNNSESGSIITNPAFHRTRGLFSSIRSAVSETDVESNVSQNFPRSRGASSDLWPSKSSLTSGYRFHSGEVVCTSKVPSPENIRTYVFQGLISKERNALWDNPQVWEDIFLDAVAQEREAIGLDTGAEVMMERYRGLCESEKKRLEHEEDRLLSTMLFNIVAFMIMMNVNKMEVKRKIRRLLGKSHIGMVHSQEINVLLDKLNQLNANDIDLKPLPSRQVNRQSFTVHAGTDSTGDLLFLEVRDDGMVLRSVNGTIAERWFFERLVNMTYSPKNKVLCLWRRQGGQTQLHKYYTKKCRDLYYSIKGAMERAAAQGAGGVTPGMELGGEFPVQDIQSGEGGLLQVCMEGVGLLFANSKFFIRLDHIRKCFTQKDGIFVLEEFNPKTRKIVQRKYKSAMADQICYAVLCVFSYVAAGQNRKVADKSGKQNVAGHLSSGGVSPRGPIFSEKSGKGNSIKSNL